MKKGVRIGQLAALCGVSTDTIRFYEREGLLPQARRDGAGHRIYDDDAEQRVRFIRRAHALGLRLADIQELTRIRRTHPNELCAWLQTRLLARLEAVTQQIVDLTNTRGELAKSLDRCRRRPPQLGCSLVAFLESNDPPGSPCTDPKTD